MHFNMVLFNIQERVTRNKWLFANPSYSLRKQLLLSYGLTSAVTIGIVILASWVHLVLVSKLFKTNSETLFRQQVHNQRIEYTATIADTLSVLMLNLQGASVLVVEITRDRIVGYNQYDSSTSSYDDGWINDKYVPFKDYYNKSTSKYPLNSPLLPLDWNFRSNINTRNIKEHVQLERKWTIEQFKHQSTAHGTYFFQGSCNSLIVDPNHPGYYPNCTNENNNIKLGGVVVPSIKTNFALYEKSADIATLLKPIYESHTEILSLSVFYANDGAGSYVQFPADIRNSLLPNYTSAGCDWLRNINPYTKNRSFATEQSIAKCRPAGTSVRQREYNILEQNISNGGFCQQFALKHVTNTTLPGDSSYHGGGVQWYGPFDYFGNTNFQVVVAGQAMSDRKSGEFIGCSALFVSVDVLNNYLSNWRNETNEEIVIVRTNDGTTFLSSNNNISLSTPITDSDFISTNDYQYLRDCLVTIRKTEKVTGKYDRHDGCNITSSSNDPGSNKFYAAFSLMGPRSGKEAKKNMPVEYILIHAVPQKNLLEVEVYSSMQKDVLCLCIGTIICGSIGLVVVIVIIWIVSKVLTEPLIWMDMVARSIVSSGNTIATNVDESTGTTTVLKSSKLSESEYHPKFGGRCTPSTEITQLVSEFNLMLRGFSGSGASTLAHAELKEIRNELTWQSDFHELYPSIPPTMPQMDRPVIVQQPVFRRSLLNTTHVDQIDPSSNCYDKEDNQCLEYVPSSNDSENSNPAEDVVIVIHTEQEDDSKVGSRSINPPKSTVPAFPKTNLNKNILNPLGEKFSKRTVPCASDMQVPVFQSSLFWWLVALIVLPMILTNSVICLAMTLTVNSAIPKWIELIKGESRCLEKATIEFTAKRKAEGAERAIQHITRDLHVITRVAGWLFFNGVKRSDGITYMEEMAEECKSYGRSTCPLLGKGILSKGMCPCEWEDLYGNGECYDYIKTDTRLLQQSYFIAEARDYDSKTGDRHSVSDKVKDSPNETEYWYNLTSMPGYESNKVPSGFQTSFDRAAVSSAMGVITFPLYNYGTKIGRERRMITSMIAFDADGMMTGYSGCSNQYATASQWVSTKQNLGSELAPKLCPLGKRGFDPRCQNWYVSGKSAFVNNSLAMFVTAPYKFTLQNQTGQTITSAIVNPSDGSYVGQTLIDFYGLNILDHDRDMSFLITPELDTKVNDTVEGPSFNDNESASIIDLLFPEAPPECPFKKNFSTGLLLEMKAGNDGFSSFDRVDEKGNKEKVYLSYQPVRGRVLLPMTPKDFSRGVSVSEILVYSLAVAFSESYISKPWEIRKEVVTEEMKSIQRLNIGFVVAISTLFLLTTCFITWVVTRPMATLLHVVRAINIARNEGDIPPMRGGSRECVQVYHLLTKLYKVVRGSNVAFFSGNLVWAFNFMDEALKIFRQVGDEKATGIACSNLGNSLHAIHHDEVFLSSSKKEHCFTDLPKMALERYNEAITIAESQFEQECDNKKKMDLLQQLSDRLFNRALFVHLLFSEGFASEEMKQNAITDISRVLELDNEAKFYWIENKMLSEKSNDHYYRLLQRALGLLEYYDDLGGLWNVESILKEADQLFVAAWNEPSLPLFHDVSRVGRLQQLELVAIQLELRREHKYEAGRLAMRMFAEDEYLIEDAFKVASTALLELFRHPDAWPYPERALRTKLLMESDLRKMLRSCRQVSLDIRKCIVFAVEINEVWKGHDVLDQINDRCLSFFDSYCLEDDYVGVVAYTTHGDLNLPLLEKSENVGKQRATLDLATTSTNACVCSSVSYAVQMLVDCSATIESDSFILLVTDSYSWDSESVQSVISQIENLNARRHTNIHIIVLGLEITRDDIIRDCKKMCSITALSKYFDVISSNDNVNQIFESIRTIVRGGVTHAPYQQGIMMEKF